MTLLLLSPVGSTNSVLDSWARAIYLRGCGLRCSLGPVLLLCFFLRILSRPLCPCLLLIPCPRTAACITYPLPKRKQRHQKRTPQLHPRVTVLWSLVEPHSLANPARWTLHNRQLAKRGHSTLPRHPTLIPRFAAAYQPNMAPAATGEDTPIQAPYYSSKPSSIFASVLHGPRDLRLVSKVGTIHRVHGELTEATTPIGVKDYRRSECRRTPDCCEDDRNLWL
jgi:hypothetical protein